MIGLHKNHPTQFYDGARGIAVLFVWMSHTSGRGQAVTDWLSFHGIGHIGVMLFFVLSGFLLSLPFKGQRPFRFTDYMIRRFLRIAPLFYLVVSLVFILQIGTESLYSRYLHVTGGFPGFLKHLVFIKGDGVFWTIPTEFVFYLILPAIALFLAPQTRGRYAIVTLIAVIYGLYHLLPIYGILDLPVLSIIDNNKPSQYLDVFILGLLAGMLTNNEAASSLYQNNKQLLDSVSFYAFVGLVVVTIVLVSKSILIWERPWYELRYLSLLYGFVFASSLYCAALGNKRLRNLFNAKPLVLTGVIGYSWYLLHMPVLQLVNTFSLAPPLAFVASTTLIVVLATCSYLFVEEPFIKMGKRLSGQPRDQN